LAAKKHSRRRNAVAVPARTYYVETHGCQMNLYDSEFICEVMERTGYTRVAGPEESSVVIVNTCSVRGRAERKALSRIREFAAIKRGGPRPAIVVAGCMAQRMGSRLAGEAGADVVVGFDAYSEIPSLLEDSARRGGAVVATSNAPALLYYLKPETRAGVTAFVTIMQGCNNFCSYCIVPYVRGRERSKPAESVLDEVKRLVDMGVKEVTLLGQNVNSYASGGLSFADLLAMANDIKGLKRIRFTTSHPKDLTRGLVEAMRDLPRVCEHLHLPLQSGSDRILHLMNRNYTGSGFRKLVDFARYCIPSLALSTDLMVGFPTETALDFQATRKALEDVRFDAAFMFRYSVREGTQAAGLPDDVPTDVKTKRLQDLLALQNAMTDHRKRAFVGREVEVLIEEASAREPGFMLGRTRENWLAKVPAEGVKEGEAVVANVRAVTRWMIVCDPPLRKVGT
jgi:tRNA-2-methylthio-N6-dimethylallyladenosine synthase